MEKTVLDYGIRIPHIKGDIESDLRKVSFDELSKKFQKCHDTIWEGGKSDPATAFDEFSKLLMSKVYDERFTPSGNEYKFQIKRNEKSEEVSKRVMNLYKEVKNRNLRVFKTDIKLANEIIYEVVKILQDISLRSTDLDIKGRAFEKFLGKIFRDEYGQYFTPREAVRFMVEILDPDENDVIIDPACGSGGFLLYSLMHIIDKVQKRYKEDKDSLNRISWDFAHKQIFGIEINDRIARIAMMDMIIHEDGHSNIECNNALIDYEKFDKKRDIRPNKYSLLFTNPPFGAVIKDKTILQNFYLGKNRTDQKTEILFIERCLELLKKNGKMAIVLPDSILTNSSLQYVRDYILKNSKVLAVVSLPQHAFVPSGAGVKSSLLFLEKTDKQNNNYNIFMGIAKHIGYDSRGEEDKNDLTEILKDWEEFIKYDKVKSKFSFAVNLNKINKNFSSEQFVFYSNNKKWEFKTLNELTGGKIFSGRTPARSAYTKEGYKVLKVRDLTNQGIDWNNEERAFVSPEFFNKNRHLKIQLNDIVFISAAHHPKYIGQKVDIVNFIPKEFENGILPTTELIIVRINSDYIDPYYVLSYLKTEDGYKSIQSCIRGQTAHIYPKDIKNVKISIPPKEELSKMESQLEILKKSLKGKSESAYKFLQTIQEIKTFISKK